MGWVNLDREVKPLVDIGFDLESCSEGKQIPVPDNCVEEFLLSHIIEHIKNPLPLMQDLYRIAAPNALCTIRVPFGASDDAWEDPTHVRSYFMGSFGYFSQPYYWRADYGYKGDWQVQEIQLLLSKEKYENVPLETLTTLIQHSRNIVIEMVAKLHAVKPLREPLKELQITPQVSIALT